MDEARECVQEALAELHADGDVEHAIRCLYRALYALFDVYRRPR